jgi:hypothetical protein
MHGGVGGGGGPVGEVGGGGAGGGGAEQAEEEAEKETVYQLVDRFRNKLRFGIDSSEFAQPPRPAQRRRNQGLVY